ncbi:D-xylose transporter [Sedimentisphaera cyanobacteriorum]|uniref:D-xylose transporter n=1 Tax=Sedimentisphaera cyanobacteriorum TaxID=1940790 RepID=A0A1Q2HSU8_9BACT|nr:sugar porter family MFS transporter [Sedimentisphaera cyanobacteriorum]AQQ10325.1 D-xylose transporter [Sedimentisphaera cyanobacteriorum]
MQHKRLFLWSVTASLAGFLFGFDTIVISGAEQKIEEVWNLSSGMHGICMSAALWGTVLGALIGGMPAEKFGRRKTLIWIGVLYLLSAIGSGMAPDKYFFIISRFIGGIGVGIATIASPMYISEIAPAGLRGRLAGMFQFNIVFGILVAFLSNYLIGRYMDESIAWRWMLGIEALPALIYSLMCIMICESPRWLIVHGGKREEGVRVFSEINPDMSEQELQSLADSVEESSEIETKPTIGGVKAQKAKFFTSKLKIPIMLAFLVAFFNQLSGINAILYFAPRIFEWTGLGESAALLKSVGIGITNLVFTYVGLYLIDKFGRRTLLYIGSFGYIASLGLCSWAFAVENYAIVPACIFAFIAAHAVGQGAVIWVLISEIFPNRFRSAGQSLGSFTHWFFAASLTLVFPKMAETLQPAAIFGFFCFMMILQLVWVKTMVPETKNVSLEEMQKKLGIQ